jgi:hypothetical protein
VLRQLNAPYDAQLRLQPKLSHFPTSFRSSRCSHSQDPPNVRHHDLMDPLSITASVIAVIQLSEKIVRVCKTYVRSVRGAPNDLRLISIEVGSLKCVLEILELLVSSDETGDHSALLEKLKGSDGPLQGCKHALSQLEQLIPTPTDRQQDIKRRKIVSSLTNLAWPLKETSARKLLDEIGRHKATITLFLTTDTMYAEHCTLDILHGLCSLQT